MLESLFIFSFIIVLFLLIGFVLINAVQINSCSKKDLKNSKIRLAKAKELWKETYNKRKET